jgi:hypothetical protein
MNIQNNKSNNIIEQQNTVIVIIIYYSVKIFATYYILQTIFLIEHN